MIVSVDEAKLYLRVDGNEEDVQIQLLINAAEDYLLNATGRVFDSSDNLAKLFCLVLVCDWFENRELVGKTSEKIRPIITSILTQLTYCGEVVP